MTDINLLAPSQNPQDPERQVPFQDPQKQVQGGGNDNDLLDSIVDSLGRGEKVEIPAHLRRRVEFVMSRAESRSADRQLEMMAFQRAMRSDPELAGEAQRLGIETGLDPKVVERNIGKARELQRRMQLERLQTLKDFPLLAEAMQYPDFSAVAADDIDKLGVIEKTVKFAQQGYLRSEQGIIWDRIRQGIATTADRQRAMEIEQSLFDLPQDTSGQGLLGGLWYGTWSRLGQLTESLPEALGLGTAAASTALVLGQMGPQVAFPEEVLSVPTMFWAGFRAGIFGNSAAVEAGQAYKSMREMGIDHQTASGAAWTVGAVNGALEVAGFGSWTKTLRGELKQMVTREVAKDLIAKPTLTAAAKKFAVSVLKDTGGEVVTEVLQEVTAIIGEQAALMHQESVDPARINEDRRAQAEQFATRIGGIIAETIRGTLLLSSVGPMIHARREIQRVKDANHTEKFITNLGKGIEEAKTSKRAPNMLQRFLRTLSEGSPVENIYFKPDEFGKAMEQVGISNSQLAEIAPDVAKALGDSAHTGIVEIPTHTWGARFMSGPLGQALAQDARVDPDGVSIREVREVAKEETKTIVERAKQVLDEKEQTDKQFVEEVKAVREDMVQQLVQAGRTPDEATPQALLYSQFATIYADAEKMTPKQWHAMHGLRFLSEEGAPKVGRPLQQFEVTEGEANEEAMQTLLSAPGEAPTIGAERGQFEESGINKLTSAQGSTRYVYTVDGTPVSVVQVVSTPEGKSTIANAYTAPEYRRQGYAEALMRQALADFPNSATTGLTAAGAGLMKKATKPLALPTGGAVPAAIPPWLVSKTRIKITPERKKAAAKAAPKAALSEANYAKIDAVFEQVPNPLESEAAWNKFMALLTGNEVVLAAPLQAIEYAKNPQLIADYLKRMRPDQLASRRQGFALGRQIAELYQSGKATPILTGRILLWGMLSRSAGAFPHESAFMDLVRAGVDQWIWRALDHEWTDADADAFVEWSKLFMGSLKGGLSPATQVTSNANDFGRRLLLKLSKRDGDTSALQRLHDKLKSKATTSEIRRFFFTLGDGIGIQNKVFSFVLLVTGRVDTLVLDRVQLTHMWGPKYQARALKGGVKKSSTGVVNIYDPPPGEHGRTGLAPAGEGHIGIAVYEALARGLSEAVKRGYELAGLTDEGDGQLGAWHWDSWLVQSSQAIAHPTIEALPTERPRRDLSVRQGKFDTFGYGTRYRADGRYEVPLLTGPGFVLMEAGPYNDFLRRISKASGGVVPKGFKVSSYKSSPWVDAPEVNRARYDELALDRGQAVGTAVQPASPLRARPVADAAAVAAGAGSGARARGEGAVGPDLIALHNLTAENLQFADDLGGLPVPSIGIVTSRTGEIAEFGEITLIGSREMVDPAKGVPVFSGDAWTVRFPEPLYDVRKPPFEKFIRPITDWAPKHGLSSGTLWALYGQAAATGNPRKTKWELLRDDTVRAWFLSKVLGVELQFPKSTYDPRSTILVIDRETRDAVMGTPAYISYSMGDWETHNRFTDQLAQIVYDAAEKKQANEPDRLEILRSTFLDEDGKLEGWRVMKEFERAQQQLAMEELGKLDERAFSEFLDQQFTKERQAQFASWVDKQVDELYGEPFLGSKRKRIAWTLNSIVDEMARTKVKNKEKTMTFGAGKAAAAVAEEFRSLQAIRDAAPKIVEDHELYTEKRKQVEDQLSQYREAAASYWGGDTWAGLDASMRALSRALKAAKTPTETTMLRALQAEGFFIPAGLSTRYEQMTPHDVEVAKGGTSRSIKFLEQARDAAIALRDMPVPYFEAKPLRAVKLSEFKAAVVPHDIGPEVEAILTKHGVPIERYRRDILAGPPSRARTVRRAATEKGALFAPTGRGLFYPKLRLAILKKDADPSTVIHEMSHFFFTTMVRVASSPEAPKQIRDDVETVLRWFAEKGGLDVDAGGFDLIQQWNSLSEEQQEKFHEMLSYNFELYAFEGKAPTPKLEGLFARMRTWMLRVYRNIRDRLNLAFRDRFSMDLPMLTPEVRAVFDRMLASQETIEQAEAIRRMLPLYQTKDAFLAAGFAESQWDEYQAVLREAHEAAITDLNRASLSQMRWLKNARSRVLKDLQKKAAAERKAVEDAIREEVKQEQVYMALELLRESNGEGKLSLEAVRGMLANLDPKARAAAEKKLGTGRKGALSTKGMDPEVARTILGYESADEMVRAMIAARPIDEEVDARTDQEMALQHGELTDPQRLEAAVERALHNEARARFIAVEQRFLTGVGKPARVMVAAARFAAQRLLEERTLRSLRPDRYAQAEARAAREAEKASTPAAATKDKERRKEGDPAAAIVAKQRQLLNNQLVAEAIKAKEEIAKFLQWIKRFERSNERLAKGGYDVDVIMAARWLLARTGLLSDSMTDRTVNYLEMLQTYDPTMFESLQPIMARFAQGPFDFRDLTLGEFRALADSVRSLWWRAKRDREIVLGERSMRVDEAIRTLVAQVSDRVPKQIAGEAQALTKAERVGRLLLGTKGNLTRVEHLFRAFDGGEHGVFSQLLFDELRLSLDRYRVHATKFTKRLVELVRALPLDHRPIDATKEFGYTFAGGDAELVGLLLHMGNRSNKEKALVAGRGDGRSWADVDVDGVVDETRWLQLRERLIREGRLTQAHFDFAQQVWDLMEQIKPLLQDAHRYLEGYIFKEVPAEEFTIEFADGTTKTYRGGYVPAAADKDLMGTADDPVTPDSLQDDFRQEIPKVQFGNVIERVESYKKRPLTLDVRQIAQHIDKAMRFAFVQPRIHDVLKILKGSYVNQDGQRISLEGVLNRIHPNLVKNVLIPWLDRAASQTLYKPGGDPLWNWFGKFLRRNTGIALMMLNPVNALQQLTGITASLNYVDAHYLTAALRRYGRERGKLVEWIVERSEFMDDRLKNQTFSLRSDLDEMLLDPSSWAKLQEWTSRKAYALQGIVQNQVDIVTWVGAFDQAMAKRESNETAEQHEKRAIAEANSAVRLAQGSFTPEDVANYEVGTPWQRAWTQFTGFFNNVLNAIGYSNHKVRAALLSLSLPMIVSEAIAKTLWGAWKSDEEPEEDRMLDGWVLDGLDIFVLSQLRGAAAFVPAVGPAAMALVEQAFDSKRQFGDRVAASPALVTLYRSVTGLVGVIRAAASEDTDLTGGRARDAMTAITQLTGAPLAPLGRPLSYLVDWARDKIEPTGALDVLRGLITGRASTATKQ